MLEGFPSKGEGESRPPRGVCMLVASLWGLWACDGVCGHVRAGLPWNPGSFVPQSPSGREEVRGRLGSTPYSEGPAGAPLLTSTQAPVLHFYTCTQTQPPLRLSYRGPGHPRLQSLDSLPQPSTSPRLRPPRRHPGPPDPMGSSVICHMFTGHAHSGRFDSLHFRI